jgi:glycosyltransferase involved in cell wall biosynthesis
MAWVLLRHLDRSRIEPHVVILQPGPFEQELEDLGVSTTVLPTGRLRQPRATARAVRALAGLLKRERPDLIVNWSPKTQLYGGAAARLAGMGDRVIWWQHGIPDGHWLDRLATALPARGIGCSSQAGAAAQRRLWPHRSTFVVHPGIDAPAAASPGELDELRKQIGLPPGRVVVGTVGRLQPWKGQDRLLQAIAQLRSKGLDLHGLIVGGDAYELSPEYARQLQHLVVQLDLEGAVTMPGQVDNVAPYMQLMDVFVNASDAEPFGIVLVEAMALGVPVVAVASGGPLEIVDPGRSGELARTGDPESLAHALLGLVGDPDLRRRRGEEGRRAATRFSASAMAEGMQSHWEALGSQAR